MKKTGRFFPSWPHKHQEAFTAAGIRLSKAKPPGRLGESPWYHALPDREREIVLFAALSSDAAGPVMQTDCSQSISRMAVNRKEDMTNTLTPGMVLFDHRLNRIIVPYERLSLQAVPFGRHRDCYQAFSPNNIACMAGNAFSGTVCFAALLTMCVHVLPNVMCDENDCVHEIEQLENEASSSAAHPLPKKQSKRWSSGFVCKQPASEIDAVDLAHDAD